MGIFKDAKARTLAEEATKARANGQTVFAAMLNTPATQHTMSGEINDWSLMIAAVESAGWVLTNWTTAADTKGRPQAYPLFRLAQLPQ